MIVLGIANDETSSACLVVGGEVVAAASEERFTRIKMDDSWPQRSIEYVLRSQNITIDDVDAVAYGWSEGFDAEKHLLPYFDRIVYEARNNYEGIEVFRDRIHSEIERDSGKREEFRQFILDNGLEQKIFYFNHHECHALSAFTCSPFDSSLVVTADGRGDFDALTVSRFDGKGYEVLYRASSNDSLGFFYGRITALLGYQPHRHEGKVTGLAAHGDPSIHLSLMQEMIRFEGGKLIAVNGKWYRPFYSNFSPELKERIKSAKPEDIAAAAQKHLENLVCEVISYYLDKTGEKYVCLAGGVFANVLANQKILELEQVENIFVQPHMGDGGLALGAAVGTVFQQQGVKIRMPSMYLGPEPGEESHVRGLVADDPELVIYQVEDVAAATVAAISENRVVGMVQGRMEFGPRALCHRSIIYHCGDSTVNDWLNKRMSRTEFMPFAPVTTEELAPSCFTGWKKEHVASRFMTVTYHCEPEFKQDCPAVVHIDGTARPQVVRRDDDPLVHSILSLWHEKTGCSALINTSFNSHGEPIICTAEDALNSLKSGTVDLLVFDGFVVESNRGSLSGD